MIPLPRTQSHKVTNPEKWVSARICPPRRSAPGHPIDMASTANPPAHAMCTGRCLIAGVARALLTYAECPVSGTRMHAGHITVCARPVPECRVRSCGVGGRRDSEGLPGCLETVPDTAGGRRPLVVVHETGRNWGVCRCVSAWRTDRRNE